MTTEQLSRYLDKSCYKGYNDNPQGFFAVYRTLFNTLEKEEEDYGDINSDENLFQFHEIKTSFGKQEDKYEQLYEYEGNETSLKMFYNKWLNFSTMKSFSWCDRYKPSDAPDRRIRRLIEKENKKLRDSEKKKYNDLIRSLAAFIKKQDPRVKAFINEQKEKEKLKKLEAKERREREKAERLKKKEEYQEQEWMKVSEDNEVLKMINDIDDEDMYIENDDFYCMACNKQFRSEKQWENHQKSKKHLKAVKILRKQLMEEMGEEYIEEDDDIENINDDNDDDDIDNSNGNNDDNNTKNDFELVNESIDKENIENIKDREVQGIESDIKDNNNLDELNQKINNININDDIDLSNQYNIIDDKLKDNISDFVFIEEENDIQKNKKKKNKKKSKIKQNNDFYQDDLFESSRSNSFDSLMNMDSILSGSKKKNKKKKRNVVPLPNLNDFTNENNEIESDNENQDEKSNEENNNKLNETENNNKDNITTKENNDTSPDTDENLKDIIKESPQPKKLKGKKAKEARLKARKEKEALAETRCRVCNLQFNSKNALFNHIKETGHSLALPEEIETKSKKKNKKRR